MSKTPEEELELENEKTALSQIIEELHANHYTDHKLAQYYCGMLMNVAFARNVHEIDLIKRSLYDPDEVQNSNSEAEPKQCIVCQKELYPIDDDWTHMQPRGGGEVRFTFSFGSVLDDIPEPKYSGVVCDNCAESVLPYMERIK